MRTCVRRVSGVPTALEPALFVRTGASVINTMGHVTVLQDSWAEPARTRAQVDVSVKDAK